MPIAMSWSYATYQLLFLTRMIFNNHITNADQTWRFSSSPKLGHMLVFVCVVSSLHKGGWTLSVPYSLWKHHLRIMSAAVSTKEIRWIRKARICFSWHEWIYFDLSLHRANPSDSSSIVHHFAASKEREKTYQLHPQCCLVDRLSQYQPMLSRIFTIVWDIEKRSVRRGFWGLPWEAYPSRIFGAQCRIIM